MAFVFLPEANYKRAAKSRDCDFTKLFSSIHSFHFHLQIVSLDLEKNILQILQLRIYMEQF